MCSNLILCTASNTFRILAYLALCFFRYTQVYSILFSVIVGYSCILRTLCNSRTFTTLLYSEPSMFRTGGLFKTLQTMTRHIRNPAKGHYSAKFRYIQNLVQRLHTQKPGIVRILKYSEPSHNCIPTDIQNPVLLTTIWEYLELSPLKVKSGHIIRALSKK